MHHSASMSFNVALVSVAIVVTMQNKRIVVFHRAGMIPTTSSSRNYAAHSAVAHHDTTRLFNEKTSYTGEISRHHENTIARQHCYFFSHFCSLIMPHVEIEICKHRPILRGIQVKSTKNGMVWNRRHPNVWLIFRQKVDQFVKIKALIYSLIC